MGILRQLLLVACVVAAGCPALETDSPAGSGTVAGSDAFRPFCPEMAVGERDQHAEIFRRGPGHYRVLQAIELRRCLPRVCRPAQQDPAGRNTPLDRATVEALLGSPDKVAEAEPGSCSTAGDAAGGLSTLSYFLGCDPDPVACWYLDLVADNERVLDGYVLREPALRVD